MNSSIVVEDQLRYIQHIIDTVPFGPGSKPKGFFLDVYSLTYGDIQSLNITEKSWESLIQVSANKLLKLSISFGNLIKTYNLEKAQHESRNATQQKQQSQQTLHRQQRQSVDPFQDTYANYRTPCVAPYYASFTKSFYLILKNFDIGTAAGTSAMQNSRLSQFSRPNTGDLDLAVPGNGSANNGVPMGSPIRLNSRQLLVEKLEINVSLDALFTFKINLQLLSRLFMILQQSLRECQPSEDSGDDHQRKSHSDSSSIFSTLSTSSSGIDSLATPEEYARLVAEVARRVGTGILDPFAELLRESIVKPNVLSGFQELLNTI